MVLKMFTFHTWKWMLQNYCYDNNMCFCILLTVLHNIMRHSDHSENMPSESQRETPHTLKDMTLIQSTAALLYEQTATAARNNNCPTFTTFNSSQCAVQSVHWLQWWAHTVIWPATDYLIAQQQHSCPLPFAKQTSAHLIKWSADHVVS